MARGTKRKKPGATEDEFDEQQEVKRPKSGYHTYANGLINVKPKGPEIAIAKRNSESSPLLRLPREIRDKIWEEVLANRVLQPVYRGRKKLPECYRTISGSKMNLGLLLTCRQVYSETALLPFEGNTFVFDRAWCAAHDVRKIKKVYRGYIRHIQIDNQPFMYPFLNETLIQDVGFMLPGLSSILLGFGYMIEPISEEIYVECIQQQLNSFAKHCPKVSIDVTIHSQPHLAQKLVMPVRGAC